MKILRDYKNGKLEYIKLFLISRKDVNSWNLRYTSNIYFAYNYLESEKYGYINVNDRTDSNDLNHIYLTIYLSTNDYQKIIRMLK